MQGRRKTIQADSHTSLSMAIERWNCSKRSFRISNTQLQIQVLKNVIGMWPADTKWRYLGITALST